jgi:hypothetical protein
MGSLPNFYSQIFRKQRAQRIAFGNLKRLAWHSVSQTISKKNFVSFVVLCVATFGGLGGASKRSPPKAGFKKIFFAKKFAKPNSCTYICNRMVSQ